MFPEVVERLTSERLDQAHATVPLKQLRAGSTQQGNVYAIVVRIAMVQHYDRVPIRPQYAMNFANSFCGIRRVMQYAVRIDQVKTFVRKIEILGICRLKVARKIEKLETLPR